MKKNMGIADRVIRTFAALFLLFLIIMETVTGTWAIILGAVAGLFLITSTFSFCPMYVPLKLSSIRKQKS